MSLWRKITIICAKLAKTHYLSIPTWLALGATLQLLLLACLPARVSSLLPVLYLAHCVFKTFLDTRNETSGSLRGIKRGKWTAELPEPEGNAESDGLVVFVLIARMNQYE